MASARIVATRAFASIGGKVARPAVRASFASTAAKRTITGTFSLFYDSQLASGELVSSSIEPN